MGGHSNLPAHLLKTKWDWDLAFALYCGGMTFDQIIATEWFRGMNKSLMYSMASKAHWKDKRENMRQRVAGAMATNLTERIVEAAEVHQNFILDEIENERQAFRRQPKTLKSQIERLHILEKLDNVARKTLKLDESKEVDKTQQNFAILVYLQQHTPQGVAGASTGILRSKNGHIEGGSGDDSAAQAALEAEMVLDNPIKVLNGHPNEAVYKECAIPGANGKPMPLGLFKTVAPIGPAQPEESDPYAIEPSNPDSSN